MGGEVQLLLKYCCFRMLNYNMAAVRRVSSCFGLKAIRSEPHVKCDAMGTAPYFTKYCRQINQIWRQCATLGLRPTNVTNTYLSISVFLYLLTPWCRVLLEKLTGLQPVKKFPAFYGTRRFIATLTSARHLSLSWASPIQSTYSHPTSWRSILILSTHLRLGLPSGLFPSGFPTKTSLYTPSLHPYPPQRHIQFLKMITEYTEVHFFDPFRKFCVSDQYTVHGIYKTVFVQKKKGPIFSYR